MISVQSVVMSYTISVITEPCFTFWIESPELNEVLIEQDPSSEAGSSV